MMTAENVCSCSTSPRFTNNFNFLTQNTRGLPDDLMNRLLRGTINFSNELKKG